MQFERPPIEQALAEHPFASPTKLSYHFQHLVSSTTCQMISVMNVFSGFVQFVRVAPSLCLEAVLEVPKLDHFEAKAMHRDVSTKRRLLLCCLRVLPYTMDSGNPQHHARQWVSKYFLHKTHGTDNCIEDMKCNSEDHCDHRWHYHRGNQIHIPHMCSYRGLWKRSLMMNP